jgi:hypothetical protein
MTPRLPIGSREVPCERPPPSLLLAAWESYMTPSQPKSKIPIQTGGNSYFLIEKSPKTAFYIYKNL